jgi:hypothetical protein
MLSSYSYSVVSCALILAFAYMLFIPDVPVSGTVLKLGQPGYDVTTINAPTTSGIVLDKIATFVSRSLFGPW